MTTTPRPGRPPREGRPASRATRLYLYAIRSAIYDLQVSNGATDTEMLQILTMVCRDLAARLPEENHEHPTR